MIKTSNFQFVSFFHFNDYYDFNSQFADFCKMAKAVIFCCALILLGFASCQTTDEIDLNKLFDEVFTKSPGETPIPNGANVVTPTPNQGGAFVTSAPAAPVKVYKIFFVMKNVFKYFFKKVS